ncbi:MAG: nucleotide-diphospho-sugar transferase [Marivirga sp.]|nr:nucleotide-diphospho-sugar transferase [Marivirga sp.]
MEASLSTPVLFIIFNRPETTQLVFEAIRKVRPPRLYVAADGPRPNVTTDKARCEQARKIVDQIDWPCELKTLFRENNLNCGKGPASAMTWFFEHETEGIILEDDCLPSETFFWFCQELLERYRDDNRVMHIGGNNFLDDWKSNNHSYYFSRNGFIWGWATWRRAWNLFDYDIKLYEKVKAYGYFDNFFLNRFEKLYRLGKFDKTAARRGQVDWWDYQWEFCRYINSGLSIVPQKNMVKNLGFGADATHTTNEKSRSASMEAFELQFPLNHPPYIVRDIETDKRYFTKFIKDILRAKFPV